MGFAVAMCCEPCAKSCGFMAFLVISCVIALAFACTAVGYFVGQADPRFGYPLIYRFTKSTEYKFLLAMLCVGLACVILAFVFAIVAMCCKPKDKKGKGKGKGKKAEVKG